MLSPLLMRVRAIAVGTERSNAIGAVELECAPHGLLVVYLGVGTFSEGYAPGALTQGTRVLVPWADVLEARVEGDQVFLSVTPTLTPHHRLCLTRFSSGDIPPLATSRERAILWTAVVGAALVTTLLLSLTLPRFAPRAGAGVTVGVGAIAALIILALGFLSERRVLFRGLDDRPSRDAFATELSHYLPTLVRLPHAPEPTLRKPALPDISGWMPRTTAALAIALTAGLLGLAPTGKSLLFPSEQRPRAMQVDEPERPMGPMLEPQVPATLPAAAAPTPKPDKAPAPAATPAPSGDSSLSRGGRCTCARADSVLWRQPIPKLSILVLDRHLTTGPSQKRLEINVAAVNNSDAEVRELTMRIAFTEPVTPGSTELDAVSHRAVYFEGPLTPGQAIKWTVEARGSDIRIEPPLPGDIGPGGDGAAPLNRLSELLNANHRPVRLHGAMMLAYLGDPRAREASLKLKEALREDEGPFLDRIIRALSDLRACEFSVSGSGATRQVQACVFNAGSATREKIGVRLRGLEGPVSISEPTREPPQVTSEATWSLPGSLEAQEGTRIRASLALSGAEPAEFELVVDREDLLP
ncbi:MAG TPA: hypothetical protein PKA88_02325 [Polyangiaceae bacterium]|nr:hypothetical protein [Polyangiaceae bacterium]